MEPSDSACRRAVHFTQLAITLPHEKGQPAVLTDDSSYPHTLSHVVFFRRCSSLRERHSPPPSPPPTHPTLGPFPLPFLGKNLLLHGHRLLRKSRLRRRIRQHRRMQLQRPVPILSFGPSRLQALERQRRGDSQRHRAHHLPHQANTPFHQVSKKIK